MAGSGSGSRLPTAVLVLAGVSTFVAVVVSAWSIYLQLKNYRKPSLQRMVIRIMLMVPLYALSSLISLFSVEAAFVIDAIRDIYEAFVIYCFFVLLLSYLGGERSLLIMLHGREPKQPVFPISLFKHEIDVSDPHTFLFLKRGILQYVQVKPILAAATLILKACGKYNEGDFRANSGYLYISIIYNTSICLSLYCLAMFWVCVNDDLKPFRPVPKFLCVKGILFFSFWQSIGVSVLVAAHVIHKLGPYTDPEHVSTGLNDLLICVEMPFFAFAHMYAFSYRDYIDPHHTFVARMPFYYAFRDAFGLLDVIEDSKTTLRGEGMDYREFEPAEGFMHQGAGRDRRIRAGLRYSKGGQRKYWLPKASASNEPPGRAERIVNRAITKIAGNHDESVRAPLLSRDAENVVHLAPDMMRDREDELSVWGDPQVEDGFDLPFGDLDEGDEELFDHSKKYLFGDYNYPCVDVSSEGARTMIWDEEERVLRDERGAWFSPIRGAKGQEAIRRREGPAWQGYGAVGSTHPRKVEVGEVGEVGEGKVIDYEQDRMAMEGRDTKDDSVIMKWTKARNPEGSGSRPSSQAYSKSPNINVRSRVANSTPSDSSSSSSLASGNRLLSPPTMLSRSNSKLSNTGGLSSPVLPSDAVDLVVEDPKAMEEETTWERRKGEPTTRSPGLKKLYRKGFESHTSEGRTMKDMVEVREAGGRNERRLNAAEDITHAIDDDHDDDERPGNGESREQNKSSWDVQGVAGSVLTRAATPPLHVRFDSNRFGYGGIPGQDDNPWA